MIFGGPHWEILRSLLAANEVARACSKADVLWETAVRTSTDATLKSFGLIRRVHFVSRPLRNFICDGKLWSAVEEWAGSNIKLCSLCISVRTSEMIFHPAHSDREHTGADGLGCVTALIPFGEVNKGNGGTYFALNGVDTTPDLRVGDVLLWNGATIHGAGAVNRGETRKALIARWVPANQVELLNAEYRPVMDSKGSFSGRVDS